MSGSRTETKSVDTDFDKRKYELGQILKTDTSFKKAYIAFTNLTKQKPNQALSFAFPPVTTENIEAAKAFVQLYPSVLRSTVPQNNSASIPIIIHIANRVQSGETPLAFLTYLINQDFQHLQGIYTLKAIELFCGFKSNNPAFITILRQTHFLNCIDKDTHTYQHSVATLTEYYISSIWNIDNHLALDTLANEINSCTLSLDKRFLLGLVGAKRCELPAREAQDLTSIIATNEEYKALAIQCNKIIREYKNSSSIAYQSQRQLISLFTSHTANNKNLDCAKAFFLIYQFVLKTNSIIDFINKSFPHELYSLVIKLYYPQKGSFAAYLDYLQSNRWSNDYMYARQFTKLYEYYPHDEVEDLNRMKYFGYYNNELIEILKAAIFEANNIQRLNHVSRRINDCLLPIDSRQSLMQMIAMKNLQLEPEPTKIVILPSAPPTMASERNPLPQQHLFAQPAAKQSAAQVLQQYIHKSAQTELSILSELIDIYHPLVEGNNNETRETWLAKIKDYTQKTLLNQTDKDTLIKLREEFTLAHSEDQVDQPGLAKQGL